MINLNKVLTHLLAGIVVGVLIGGIGARVAMRVVALLLAEPVNFSVAGTLLILILFGMLGAIFGLLFGAVRNWLPGNRWLQGGSYGVVWMALFASCFFMINEGEFGLLAPWQGAALFAPLALLQGLTLPAVLDPFTTRWADRSPRLVGRGWFVLFFSSLLLAFLGMTSLLSDAIRLPRAVSAWIRVASSENFRDVYEFHRFLGMLFLLTWCGLVVALFVRKADTRLGRLAALALTLFAAGWFNVNGMAAAIFERTLWVDGVSWLLRIIGAGALLYLLVEVARTWWQAVAISRQIRPALWGMIIAVGWFVGIWISTLFIPALTFRNAEIFAPLAVTVYLFPWLALPLGLLVKARTSVF